MKKILSVFVAIALLFALVCCGETKKYSISYDLDGGVCENLVEEFEENQKVVLPTPTKEGYTFVGWYEGEVKVETIENKNYSLKAVWEEVVVDNTMSYADYIAAELDTDVVICGYVQGKQSWWDNKATVYLQDQDGAYFVYNMACSEEDYAKLVKGTKIKVSGTKAAWSGEIEIIDATFEILEGNFIAEAKDLTNLLGTDELIKHQNEFVSFKGLEVVASEDAEGNKVAWIYKHNGTGKEGDDLYFKVKLGENVYTFTVESYLCGSDTEVYQKVKALQIGDVIDLECFLYWYNGANPHVTSVSKLAKDYMSYAEYSAAELDTDVVICGYVQGKQSWWDNKATVYLQDQDGAYFVYNMACSEEDYAKLVKGTKIKVSGTKAAWSGEIEIIDATFEILEGNFIAEAKDLTNLLGTDELIKHQNEFVSFKGLEVVASEDAEGNKVAWIYKHNGTGKEGDDLYFKVKLGENVYTFTVESYLCGSDTEVYQKVKALQIGDVIDLECFLYWYNGANPHVTSVSK